MRNFKFEKESTGRWYVVLPEWEGNKEDLEMVMGADTLLDIIAQGESEVNLIISEKPFSTATYILTIINHEYEGANYLVTSKLHNFNIWLCKVTTFLFGKFPEILYIS